MLPFAAAVAAGAGDPAPRWVGGFFMASGTSAALSTIKARPGDFAIYASPNNPSPTSGSGTGSAGGWTYIGSDGVFYIAYKRLSEADVAAGVSGADFILGIWRGAIFSAAIVGGISSYPNYSTGTTTDVVRGAKHLGLVALSYVDPYADTAVSGFTSRGYYSPGGKRRTLFDRLAPPNGPFVDHDPITATYAGADYITASILELRSA